MKKYLNMNEVNDLLFLFNTIEINTIMVSEWIRRGNLTSQEAKKIRTATTMNKNAIKSILDRLEPKAKDNFRKRMIRAQQEPVRILDKWMHDRILGTYKTEFEIVKIERNELEKLGMLCGKKYCEDCSKSLEECQLYDIFENNMMSRVDKLHNCPYAFHSQKRIEEIQAMKAEIEEMKKSKKKISKRKQKKIQNRFDE